METMILGVVAAAVAAVILLTVGYLAGCKDGDAIGFQRGWKSGWRRGYDDRTREVKALFNDPARIEGFEVQIREQSQELNQAIYDTALKVLEEMPRATKKQFLDALMKRLKGEE